MLSRQAWNKWHKRLSSGCRSMHIFIGLQGCSFPLSLAVWIDILTWWVCFLVFSHQKWAVRAQASKVIMSTCQFTQQVPALSSVHAAVSLLSHTASQNLCSTINQAGPFTDPILFTSIAVTEISAIRAQKFCLLAWAECHSTTCPISHLCLPL